MTFAQTARVLLRHWWAIALATVLVGAAVFGLAATRTPLYTATASKYVSLTLGDSPTSLAQGSTYVQDQLSSYGQLATSPLVLNPVIDGLGLNLSTKELARLITVTTPRNTVIIQIDVTDSNPVRAATIANAVGSQLAVAIDGVSPRQAKGKSLIAVQSIQAALPPTVQSSPNKKRDALFGALAGLLVACGIVLARDRLDRRVRSRESLADLTSQPLLGEIHQSADLRPTAVTMLTRPESPSSEEVRQIRAVLERLATSRPSYAVEIMSAVEGEGRSTIAANLAAALAEAGRRTVLVDADLRRPRIGELTGTDPTRGLLQAIRRPAEPTRFVQPAAGFDVLTAGGTHPNPIELLSSEAMSELLNNLRHSHEFILIDTPALLTSGEGTALEAQVDGSVMIADATRVRREELMKALDTAELAGMSVLGVVLNRVSRRGRDRRSVHRRDRGRSAKSESDNRSVAAPSWENAPPQTEDLAGQAKP